MQTEARTKNCLFFNSHFARVFGTVRQKKKHANASNKCRKQELLLPGSIFLLACVFICICMSTTNADGRLTLLDPAAKVAHASVNYLKAIFRSADNNGLVDQARQTWAPITPRSQVSTMSYQSSVRCARIVLC